MRLPKPDQTNYEACQSGNHLAICCRLIDLGTQQTSWQRETIGQSPEYQQLSSGSTQSEYEPLTYDQQTGELVDEIPF